MWDNTGGEPLAWMLRRGSAGSNTTADHLQVLDAAIAAVPPQFRRKLMVTCDGADASHGLIARLDTLAARRGEGFSQADLARELGVTRQAIQKMVAVGEGRPRR